VSNTHVSWMIKCGHLHLAMWLTSVASAQAEPPAALAAAEPPLQFLQRSSVCPIEEEPPDGTIQHHYGRQTDGFSGSQLLFDRDGRLTILCVILRDGPFRFTTLKLQDDDQWILTEPSRSFPGLSIRFTNHIKGIFWYSQLASVPTFSFPTPNFSETIVWDGELHMVVDTHQSNIEVPTSHSKVMVSSSGHNVPGEEFCTFYIEATSSDGRYSEALKTTCRDDQVLGSADVLSLHGVFTLENRLTTLWSSRQRDESHTVLHLSVESTEGWAHTNFEIEDPLDHASLLGSSLLLVTAPTQKRRAVYLLDPNTRQSRKLGGWRYQKYWNVMEISPVPGEPRAILTRQHGKRTLVVEDVTSSRLETLRRIHFAENLSLHSTIVDPRQRWCVSWGSDLGEGSREQLLGVWVQCWNY
jgi:hypothetical protein